MKSWGHTKAVPLLLLSLSLLSLLSFSFPTPLPVITPPLLLLLLLLLCWLCVELPHSLTCIYPYLACLVCCVGVDVGGVFMIGTERKIFK